MEYILEVEGLTKKFGGLTAVDDLSFSVDEGEILGIIGPNGAGKTTLFNLITGFYDPNTGSVEFKGENITGLDSHQICEKGISRTFQETKLFSDMTVIDNVIAGGLIRNNDINLAREKAVEILEKIGIGDIRDRESKDLPIGKRKLVEVGRALATEPDVLLLDELAPGLTPAEVKEAQELIERLNDSGITVCLIEHVMDLVMNISERMIVLNQGEKISEGSPEEVSSDEEVIRAYTGGEV